MASHSLIAIEVAYGTCKKQCLLALQVKEGVTLQEAIMHSGILNLFPEIDLSKQAVGIFSRKRDLSHIVKAGDRVEIYRALLQDPMSARRARAKSDRLRLSVPHGIKKPDD